MQQILREYYRLKKKLLYAMINDDPLAILESGIFEEFEEKIKPNNKGCAFETIIKDYDVGGVPIKIIERKSKSCDRSENSSKYLRQEERHKVQFSIWNNIMHNHFSKQKIIYRTESSQKNRSENQNNASQFRENANNEDLGIVDSIFHKLKEKIKEKGWSQEVNVVIEESKQRIDEQISLLNDQAQQMKAQIQKLRKQLKEKSTKQLQLIVIEKQLRKKIEKIEQQLRYVSDQNHEREANLRQKQMLMDQVILKKIRKLGQAHPDRKLGLQQIRERIKLESIRRNALLQIGRSSTELQLQKQELNILKEETLNIPLETVDSSLTFRSGKTTTV